MRTIGFLLCFLMTVAISGCGGGNPTTVAATGTITLGGRAVEGATVVFGPTTEDGRVATAQTDAEGKFALTTVEPDDGAVPGSYTVAISKTETVGGMTPDAEHAAINAGKKVTEAKFVEHLPRKYKDGLNSGLQAEVTVDGENNFTFELTP